MASGTYNHVTGRLTVPDNWLLKKENGMDVMKRINELEAELRDLKKQAREQLPRVEWGYTNTMNSGCFYRMNQDPTQTKTYPGRTVWRIFAVPIHNAAMIDKMEVAIREASINYALSDRPFAKPKYDRNDKPIEESDDEG
jgi:hypothetical protein